MKTTEESLKDLNSKLQGVTKSVENIRTSSQQKEQQLLKEKNEMLELSMQRGRIIQVILSTFVSCVDMNLHIFLLGDIFFLHLKEKASENKKLQMKIDQLERDLRDVELRFEYV